MFRPLILLGFLVGCGATLPFQPKGQCSAPDWGLIFTEDVRSCECIVRHQALALSMLRQASISEDMSGLTTWLHSSEDGFKNPNGIGVDGYYLNGDAVVVRNGDPLVHEVLHYVEHLRGVDLGASLDHRYWNTNLWNDPNYGQRTWWDLANLYWAKVNPYDGGEACP